MTMFENRYKSHGQSAVELALIAVLVVSVSWGGLQLMSGKMTKGTTAFAGQYSGTPVASSSSSGAGTSSAVPTATGAVPAGSSVPSSGVVGSVPAATVGSTISTLPIIQTTGSNAYSLPGHSVSSTTTTSTQTSPANPGIVTNFKPASTFPTINFGPQPINNIPPATTIQLPQPVNNILPATTGSAQPAAADGCMGCAASMTTDLGW